MNKIERNITSSMYNVNNIWSEAVKEFEERYPSFAREAINWQPSGHCEILITLEDKSKIIYNDLTKRIRHVYDSKFDDILNDEITFRKEFGNELRRRMHIVGITQEGLSERTGLSEVTISKYMTGKATPSLYNTYVIADCLRCTVNDLLYYV